MSNFDKIESVDERMNKINQIYQNIEAKLNEVEINSEAHKYLIYKKRVIDTAFEKIILEAEINNDEYKLYQLEDKKNKLEQKINSSARKLTEYDLEMIELTLINGEIDYIKKHKLKNVKTVNLPKNLSF